MTTGSPDHEHREPRIAVVVMSHDLRPSLAAAMRPAQAVSRGTKLDLTLLSR